MKIFWALVMLLAAAAAVVWLRQPAPAPASVADARSVQSTASRDAKVADRPSEPMTQTPPTMPTPQAPPAPPAPPTPAVAAQPPAAKPLATLPMSPTSPTSATSAAPTAAEAKAASDLAAKELAAKLAAHLDEQVAPTIVPALPPVPDAAAAPAGGAASSAHPASDKAAATLSLVKQDDGTTLVDNRFSLSGAGTKDDPYRVSWEMLMSAQDTYQPRLGRKIIPERLKMLDGKWVRIGGFIAFPIMAQSQDEMLMMLNQWDGCCIGVPPTPYDAIEVKLKNPAKGDDRFRVTGTITGILRIDPYLVKDWLVSLFLMDDATIAELGGSQPSGQHSK